MSRRPYKARTLAGAEKRVNALLNLISQYEDLCNEQRESIRRLDAEGDLLAQLAAKGPCFYDPLQAFAAETLRDRRLARMGLKPNGRPLEAAK